MTLAELLVIMAIVAIAASIVVANLRPGPHPTPPEVKTLSIISNIELAVTKMLSDAGQSSLSAFFEPSRFNLALEQLMREEELDRFQASVEIYTSALNSLLRHGRGAGEVQKAYVSTLNSGVITALGDSYLTNLDTDPWGNPYQFYAGPWRQEMGPVLFRVYVRDEGGLPLPNAVPAEPDALAFGPSPVVEGATYGWPANADEVVYVWSPGENGVSDQPRYDPTHQYTAPASQHYNPNQDEAYWGGGDDINNWDRAQTYMRHYK